MASFEVVVEGKTPRLWGILQEFALDNPGDDDWPTNLGTQDLKKKK